MQRHNLGSQGLEVPALGLGGMGMSEFYGHPDDDECIATLHRALDPGVTFFDTADMYGPFTNEDMLGRAFKGMREQVLLATKFGIQRGNDASFHGVSGRPVYVRKWLCHLSLVMSRK